MKLITAPRGILKKTLAFIAPPHITRLVAHSLLVGIA